MAHWDWDTIAALATSTLHVRASVELVDGNVYLAMSLRNVGNGTAVLHGWRAAPRPSELVTEASDPATFRKQLRDLYVPAATSAFWQAAIRDASDPDHGWLQEHIKEERSSWSNFSTATMKEDSARSDCSPWRRARYHWICSVVGHWSLDRPNPR